MTVKVISTAVASLAASVALVGCGGDEALSKQALIERGDAVCAEAQRQAAAIGEPRTTAEVKQLTTLFEGMVADLRALEPPAGDRERIGALLTDLDRGVTTIGRAIERTIATGGDPKSVEANDAWRLVERASTSAQGYGFRVCGGDS
jgi:hypothetical protein